jgi:HSP20 family protein
MAISRWEPGRGALSLRDAVSQLFDQSMWWPMTPGMDNVGLQLPMDVYAEGDGYVVEAELPGVKPDEVTIEMVGNTLTIHGEYQVEAPQGRQYLVRQRRGGKFQAAIVLPDAADASRATATYEHGLLRLTIPKSEAAKPRKIAVTSGNNNGK